MGFRTRQVIHTINCIQHREGEILVDKILIAYGSKGDATEKVAKKIAQVLQEKYNFWVDLTNLNGHSVQYFNEYHAIILGTGV